VAKQTQTVVFDIETGPRPWEEIEPFYAPPEPMGPFDAAAVKTGNMGPEKAREKIERERQKWQAAKANEQAEHEQHRQEFIDKAALSPLTGQVLAIGYQGQTDVPHISAGEEPAILEFFWQGYARYARDGTPFIGHNVFGFDLPFLVQRSWYHGLAVPQEIHEDCNRYRSKVFVDTMAVWSCGQRQQFIGLNDLATYFGIEGKPEGIDGGDFHKLWHGTPEEHEQAREYLRGDLRITWEVARRLGIL